MTVQRPIDEAKLEQFMGTVVSEAGAAFNGVLFYVGDRLGLYRAMAGGAPTTPAQLAAETGTHERMVREWLFAHAAGGWVDYDATSRTFTLPAEHAAALADQDGPHFLGGLSQVLLAGYRSADKLVGAFRTGKGLGWHDQDASLFAGTERFFRPGYEANLVQAWIPEFAGLDEVLRAGGSVADVGCGHGTSTVILAKAYPAARVVGYDFHAPSIDRARKIAAEEGVADRVSFEVARATEYPAAGYDLITFFDCVHDMGDPAGAARRAREALAPGGRVMLVEPFSNDLPEENLNPVGRLYYAASSMFCTPSSLSEDGPALGAQAGRTAITEIFTGAGFGSVRVAHETPFNVVYEIKA